MFATKPSRYVLCICSKSQMEICVEIFRFNWYTGCVTGPFCLIFSFEWFNISNSWNISDTDDEYGSINDMVDGFALINIHHIYMIII